MSNRAKGVIYARYSSDNQTEQSIDGQLKECSVFAEHNNIQIVNTYIDRAISGRTEKREAFQQMIIDSKLGMFDCIIVYKIDRFARDRYIFATYKNILKKQDVKVISAMENVNSESPETIILESVLEGMAEYYSLNLSQNVRRGMDIMKKSCKYLGGITPLGYGVDDNNNYVINEKEAVAVRIIFKFKNEGKTDKYITDYLNSNGFKTSRGNNFNKSSLAGIIKNVKYIGTYNNGGHIVEDAIPAIIDKQTFQNVNSMKNVRTITKSNTRYYLAGKIYCGLCGSNMKCDAGTSGTKRVYYYYSCVNKRSKISKCNKKSIRKDQAENAIFDFIIKKLSQETEIIDNICEKVYDLYLESTNNDLVLDSLEKQLNTIDKKLDNLIQAVENGIYNNSTQKRILELEKNKRNIEDSISVEKIKKPAITLDFIKFSMEKMLKIKNKDRLFDIFINSVYMYEDKMKVIFNIVKNKKIVNVTDFEKFGAKFNGGGYALVAELPFIHELNFMYEIRVSTVF